ncbi:hypothetical protein Tco_0515953, partial [Tanacetum coccineum]
RDIFDIERICDFSHIRGSSSYCVGNLATEEALCKILEVPPLARTSGALRTHCAYRWNYYGSC